MVSYGCKCGGIDKINLCSWDQKPLIDQEARYKPEQLAKKDTLVYLQRPWTQWRFLERFYYQLRARKIEFLLQNLKEDEDAKVE